MKTTFILAIVLSALSANAQLNKIKVSELPQPAQAFLSEHFKEYKIAQAYKESQIGEKGFEVKMTDGTEVEFTKDGKWREVDGNDKPIPTAFIDKKITSYIAKAYPGKKITHIDYGHKDIDVDLEGKLDLEFDKNGNFLKGEIDD
ncbi:PepSY-like domain-containing protein [Flavobacterium selenitireducens]|uniref:PepSY-like domain-containing protein n=1 Tax=Flavobacterium selenitireducens TaxID=2722704 RepID=UPI00168AEE03|nr:PepSY-like domain-containing protein [Flavobacterium selenitireducens]MBD3582792.1 hypothetical protein [Flavobacterium selenitireducens]